jgi:hypothetical protein
VAIGRLADFDIIITPGGSDWNDDTGIASLDSATIDQPT